MAHFAEMELRLCQYSALHRCVIINHALMELSSNVIDKGLRAPSSREQDDMEAAKRTAAQASAMTTSPVTTPGRLSIQETAKKSKPAITTFRDPLFIGIANASKLIEEQQKAALQANNPSFLPATPASAKSDRNNTPARQGATPIASSSTPRLKQTKIMTKAEKLELKQASADSALQIQDKDSTEMTIGVERTPERSMASLPWKRMFSPSSSNEVHSLPPPTAPKSNSTSTSTTFDDDIMDIDPEPPTEVNNKSFEFEDDVHGLIGRHKRSLSNLKAQDAPTSKLSSDMTVVEQEMAEDLVLSPDGKLPIVRVPAAINAKLFQYQRDGIKFLYNLYISEKGGILADDMGLGKTIQTICFALAIKGGQPASTFFPNQKEAASATEDLLPEDQKKLFAPIAQLPILIVTPASLLQHWHREFSQWTKLRAFIAHGKQDKLRVFESAQGNKLDVVLMSFDTLLTSTKQLNDISFSCVIFDEAHKVKNRQSKLFAACLKLKVKRKYGLTGTMMQNSFEELWTLCQALGFAMYSVGDLDYFKRHYIAPIKEGHVQDATNAQITCASIVAHSLVDKLSKYVLRRTKACIAHQLPPKEDHIVFCEPTPLQLRIYKRITDSPLYRLLRANSVTCKCGSGKAAVKCCAKRNRAIDGPSIDFPNVALPALTRLQQLANHVSLIVPPSLIDDLVAAFATKKRLSHTFSSTHAFTADLATNTAHITNYFSAGEKNSGPSAPSSSDASDKSLANGESSSVKQDHPSHATHRASISSDMTSKTAISSSATESASGPPLSSLITSPFLKMAFGDDLEAVAELLVNGDEDMQLCGKLKVLSSLLPHWQKQGSKVLLFSSSTRVMDLLSRFCTKQGYTFGRVEGTTPIAQRQRLVDHFNRTKSQFIFIISTKACGVGLNLSSANVVVIFEPHFNVSLDMQASDRAHRIGQVRTTRVYRLVSAYTIEELTYRRQIYKQQMANIATEGRSERRFFKMSEVFGAHLLFSLLDHSQLNTVDILERSNVGVGTATGTLPSTSTDAQLEQVFEAPIAANFRVTRDDINVASAAQDGLLQLILDKAQPNDELLDFADGGMKPTATNRDETEETGAAGGTNGAPAEEPSALDQSECLDMEDLLKKAGVLHSHLNSELFSTPDDSVVHIPSPIKPSTATTMPRPSLVSDSALSALSALRTMATQRPTEEIDPNCAAFVGDGKGASPTPSFPELSD